MIMRQEVAAEVRAWAGRRNYTQTRVARVLGVSQAAVSRKYRGEVAFDIDDLAVLAAEWDIPITDLIPSQGSPSHGKHSTCIASDTTADLHRALVAA